MILSMYAAPCEVIATRSGPRLTKPPSAIRVTATQQQTRQATTGRPRRAWLRTHIAAGALDLPALPLSGDSATHIIRYASRHTHVCGPLAVLPKTITCPNCGLVLRVTQHARGSTTLIYDVNEWQRRCVRIDLGSPVMCLVQHEPHKPG